MIEKVFLAFVYYDNGRGWEDHYCCNELLDVASDYDKAVKEIDQYIEARSDFYKSCNDEKYIATCIRSAKLICDKNEEGFHLYDIKVADESHADDFFANSSYIYYILEKEVSHS